MPFRPQGGNLIVEVHTDCAAHANDHAFARHRFDAVFKMGHDVPSDLFKPRRCSHKTASVRLGFFLLGDSDVRSTVSPPSPLIIRGKSFINSVDLVVNDAPDDICQPSLGIDVVELGASVRRKSSWLLHPGSTRACGELPIHTAHPA
jgi:hypothetical protein